MNLENLSTKKIIFIWVSLFLVILIWIMFSVMSSSWKKWKTTWKNLVIWTFWDDKNKFYEFIWEFKKDKNLKKVQITNENFNSWQDYNLALESALASWKAPDIFVLNSSEISVFENQIQALDPKIFNPDDFIKNYKSFFVWDLILSTKIWKWKEAKKQEFVKWIPVWYETLWIYYNRFKWILPKDFKSWASLNSRIDSLKEDRPDITPIALWWGSSIYGVSDIVTQFLMLEWATSLKDLSDSKIKSALNTYFLYWDKKLNWYFLKEDLLKNSRKNNLDLFSRWEVAMVVGYPRLLQKIDDKWFRKAALYVAPFPSYYAWSGKSLVNYNYFVINKDSKNFWLAEEFLSYLNSDLWAKKYLEKFPYYLPARVNLEEDLLDKEIIDWYHIKLKNFINNDLEKSSFDKWVKMIYDSKLKEILNDRVNYIDKFIKLKDYLLCLSKKIRTLDNLSSECRE